MTKTKIGKIKSDAILFPMYPSVYTLSPYVGCPYDCKWEGEWGTVICGAKEFTLYHRESLGLPPDWVANIENEWRHILVISNAVELLGREWPVKQPSRIVMDERTDPYPPEEKNLKLIPPLIDRIPGPVTIITKCTTTLPARDFDLLLDKPDPWFGVSLWQGDVPAQENQFRLLREAKAKGLQTFVSLSPWLPGEDLRPAISSLKDIADYFCILPLHSGGRAVAPRFYQGELPSLISWLIEKSLQDRVYLDPTLLSAAGIRYHSARHRPESLQWRILRVANILLGMIVSILVIGIDDLLRIKTSLGYSTARQILTEVDAILRKVISAPDALSPQGGEQWILLAPQTDTEAARIKAEELCRLVRGHSFEGQEEGVSVSASIGIATFPDHGRGEAECMHNALIAFDRARARGGNQVCVYSEALLNNIGVKWPWHHLTDTPPLTIPSSMEGKANVEPHRAS